jgi:NAD(P)-dependent dehydrogenase (short-subunit alcohol dehydrogenase family)
MGGSLSKTFVDSLPTQQGKIIAITGCTSGTGLNLAKTAVEKGASIIMLNRESQRAVDAFDLVKTLAKEEDKVFKIDCDLMSIDSVKKAAEEVKSQFPDGIDVLCNNAGIMAFPNEATKDGYDVQMQVNHLSHFLLTKELLPILEKKAEVAGEARIVNHSSIARFGVPLDRKYLEKNGGDEILGDNEMDMANMTGGKWERYHHTKLANMVFTYALKDKLSAKGSKVIAAVAHPGVSKTKLMENTLAKVEKVPLSTKIMLSVMGPAIFQSVEDGTIGIGRCCLQEGVKSGDFYGPAGGRNAMKGDAVLLEPEDICTDEESKKMLWEVSEAAVGKFDI